MPSDKQTTLQDDIAYMRSLAEAGDRGGAKNGVTLFLAGVIFAIAACVQYGFVTHLIPMPNPWFGALDWFGATLIFAVAAIIFRKRNNGVPSGGDRGVTAAWSGLGIAIIAFIATVFIISARMQQMEELSFLFAPVILVFYGIGWWVSAAVRNSSWFKLISLGCFAAAPLLGLMAGMAEQLLAYAVCLVLFAMLPGLKLMQEARAQA